MVRLFRRAVRGRLLVAAACLVCPALSGCVNTVDTVTGQKFRGSPFKSLWSSEDPMEVLRRESNADARSKAMLKLEEPRKRGGSEQDQAEALKILSETATNDKQVICRLSAIEALGRFEDPQAAPILVAAFRQATGEAPVDPAPVAGVEQAGRRSRLHSRTVTNFTPDNIVRLQCSAVESLAKKKTPESLNLLCEIANKPVPKEVRAASLETLLQGDTGQEGNDLRLSAVRSLANFRGDAKAAQTLYRVMITEKAEVALKSRAHMSLMEVTGRDYPPDSAEWLKIVPPVAGMAAPINPTASLVIPASGKSR